MRMYMCLFMKACYTMRKHGMCASAPTHRKIVYLELRLLFETLAGWHVRTDGAHATKNCSAAAWRSVSRPTATLDAERVRAIRRGRREVARQAASS